MIWRFKFTKIIKYTDPYNIVWHFDVWMFLIVPIFIRIKMSDKYIEHDFRNDI